MFRLVLFALAASLALFGSEADDELLAASRKGDLAAVKAFVEKGAALEVKTPYGQTPLYLAAMSGHEDVVRFLLEKGASTDVQDTFYKAPMLAFVIQRKHFGVAKLLLEKGTGNVDQQLGFLVMQGTPELIQAALSKGKPSQNTLDKAYEQALSRGRTEMATLLKNAGANEPAPEAQVDAKVLESYAGNYKSEQLPLEIRVFVKDGKLFMQATGQPEFPTKAKSPTVFEASAIGLNAEFDTPSTFTLKQGGGTFKFTKAGGK